MFVCGSRDGLMQVTGRKHNTDDIIATVLAVEPMKFIYRGRIAVFAIRVLRDERICVVAEQRPDCTEEEVRGVLQTQVLSCLVIHRKCPCPFRASNGCHGCFKRWIQSIKWVFIAWHSFLTIICPRLPWEESICRKPSANLWKEFFIRPMC